MYYQIKKLLYDHDYILIIEENVDYILRSIPLLQLYDVKTFTYPFSWRNVLDNIVEYELIPHNFEHIDNIKETRDSESDETETFCMITTSYFDLLMPEYSVMSILNTNLNKRYILVLREEDALKRGRLDSFIRPIIETSQFHKNWNVYYKEMFQRTMEFLENNCGIYNNIKGTMNVFLIILAKIYEELYKETFDSIRDIVIYSLNQQLNPIYLSIYSALRGVHINLKTTVLKNIKSKMRLYLELTKKDEIAISEIINNLYYNNKFDEESWNEEIRMNKKQINQINSVINNFCPLVRRWCKLVWENILIHIS